MSSLIPGENDLATANPELAAQWHPEKNGNITPYMVNIGSGERRYWWLGKCGHEWQATVASRAAGTGCPICGRRKSITTRTQNQILNRGSLYEMDPNLAAQWHPTLNGDLTPKMVTSKSGKKIWWRCPAGHVWEASISNRSNGKGCPYCSGRFVISGLTDLATVNPRLASEWHPTKNGHLTPQNVSAGSGKKVWWLGSCGHEWQAPISRRSTGTGCPFCTGKKELTGSNALATHSEILLI